MVLKYRWLNSCCRFLFLSSCRRKIYLGAKGYFYLVSLFFCTRYHCVHGWFPRCCQALGLSSSKYLSTRVTSQQRKVIHVLRWLWVRILISLQLRCDFHTARRRRRRARQLENVIVRPQRSWQEGSGGNSLPEILFRSGEKIAKSIVLQKVLLLGIGSNQQIQFKWAKLG